MWFIVAIIAFLANADKTPEHAVLPMPFKTKDECLNVMKSEAFASATEDFKNALDQQFGEGNYELKIDCFKSRQ
jgi:hypothetical protein